MDVPPGNKCFLNDVGPLKSFPFLGYSFFCLDN